MKPKVLIFLSVLSFIAINNAVAQEEKSSDWGFGVDIGLSNKYLWRGIVCNNGLVLQPGAYASYKDFSFSLWSNTTLYDKDDVSANEIDYTFDYSHSFSSIDVESSLSYYQFINQEGTPNTSEVFLGGTLPVGDFSVAASLWVDVLEYAGASYFELSCNYEKELTQKLSASATVLTSTGSKKFNTNYELGTDKRAINLVGGIVGLSYALNDGLSLNANFYQNFMVNKDIKETIGASSNAFEFILSKEF